MSGVWRCSFSATSVPAPGGCSGLGKQKAYQRSDRIRGDVGRSSFVTDGLILTHVIQRKFIEEFEIRRQLFH